MSLPELISAKKRELESLKSIKLLSESLCQHLEEIEGKLQIVGDGTEAVALVMSNWNTIIKSVSLASMGLAKYSESDFESAFDHQDDFEDKNVPYPEKLIRLRVENDDEQKGEQEHFVYQEEETF